jgi:hypothetical protein
LGRKSKAQSLSRVAASPYIAFRKETAKAGVFDQ